MVGIEHRPRCFHSGFRPVPEVGEVSRLLFSTLFRRFKGIRGWAAESARLLDQHLERQPFYVKWFTVPRTEPPFCARRPDKNRIRRASAGMRPTTAPKSRFGLTGKVGMKLWMCREYDGRESGAPLLELGHHWGGDRVGFVSDAGCDFRSRTPIITTASVSAVSKVPVRRVRRDVPERLVSSTVALPADGRH